MVISKLVLYINYLNVPLDHVFLLFWDNLIFHKECQGTLACFKSFGSCGIPGM